MLGIKLKKVKLLLRFLYKIDKVNQRIVRGFALGKFIRVFKVVNLNLISCAKCGMYNNIMLFCIGGD